MIRHAYQLARNRLASPVLPLELIVFVTKRCPLRCAHCFIEEFQTDPATDLPLATLQRLAEDLPSLLVVMLTGGEPFLRPDLPEVVQTFWQRSSPKVVSVTTSGWFPKPALDKVKEMAPPPGSTGQLIVSLSFDGTRDIHDQVRRRDGAYDRAMETARQLQPIVQSTEQIALGANLTLVPDNQDSILAAARELAQTGLFSFLSCNMYRESKPRSAYQGLDLQIYRDLNRFVHDYSQNFRIGANSLLGRIHHEKERRQAALIEETCRTNSYQGLPCEAGRNIGVIQADGCVTACELLTNSWGNIKDRSIVDIWNDRANRQSADDIRSTKCFCTHECFVSASMNTQVKELGHCVTALRPGRQSA